MNDNVFDITPKHKPISLARELVKHIEEKEDDVDALFAVMLMGDEISYVGAAAKRKDLLWACERFRMLLLMEDLDDE